MPASITDASPGYRRHAPPGFGSLCQLHVLGHGQLPATITDSRWHNLKLLTPASPIAAPGPCSRSSPMIDPTSESTEGFIPQALGVLADSSPVITDSLLLSVILTPRLLAPDPSRLQVIGLGSLELTPLSERSRLHRLGFIPIPCFGLGLPCRPRPSESASSARPSESALASRVGLYSYSALASASTSLSVSASAYRVLLSDPALSSSQPPPDSASDGTGSIPHGFHGTCSNPKMWSHMNGGRDHSSPSPCNNSRT